MTRDQPPLHEELGQAPFHNITEYTLVLLVTIIHGKHGYTMQTQFLLFDTILTS